MVRIARQDYLYDGCYVHVISRSIRAIKLFKDEEDFCVFIEMLKKAKERANFRVYHYCIMQTHFHMAIQIAKFLDFSKAMQELKSGYSYKYHQKYKISGPIWRERYRSLLIEDEHYLYACGQYIENNPVKAGLVNSASDWLYSSRLSYQEGKVDGFVDGYEQYAQVKKKTDIFLEEEEFFERGSVIGSALFRFQFKKDMKG